MAFLLGTPETGLLANAGDIEAEARGLENLFDVTESIGPLNKFAAGHRTFDIATGT